MVAHATANKPKEVGPLPLLLWICARSQPRNVLRSQCPHQTQPTPRDRFVAMAREQGCTTEQNPRVTTHDAAKMLEPDIVFYFGFGNTVETDITVVNPTAPCYIGRSSRTKEGQQIPGESQPQRQTIPATWLRNAWKHWRRSSQTAPTTGSAHKARHWPGSQRHDNGPSSYVGQRQRPLRPNSGHASQASRGQEKRRRTAAPLTPHLPCSVLHLSPPFPLPPFSLPSPFFWPPLPRALFVVDSFRFGQFRLLVGQSEFLGASLASWRLSLFSRLRL